MRKPYKLPTIVRSKNGDWFVKYFYELPDEPGKFKEFRARDGVNYIHDLEQKEKEIQKLKRDVTLAVTKEGYNPFEKDQSVEKQIILKELQLEKEDQKRTPWTLADAIREFKAYCVWKNLSPTTIKGYTTFLNNFSEWLADNKQLDHVASEYLETEVVKFADAYYDQEDWKPRTYNNHIDFFKTFFTRIEKLERKHDRSLKYHIDLSDAEYKTDKAEKNRAYSGVVAEKVKKELEKSDNAKVNRFIKFIYYSCMRPKEIRLLQIQHIDVANRQIKVTAPTGKTGDRFVPISDELMELIREFNINSYPFNYYLFSIGKTPSEFPFGKDHYSRLYYPIKEKLHLDKNYTMYSWKHTRVIDLSNAGFKDEEIMQLTGHRDYQAFKAYKRDLVVTTTIMTGKTTDF
jgi:integrase